MELHSPPQKKGRKNIKFSARKVARPVHGVEGENCWIRRGGGNFFFFFRNVAATKREIQTFLERRAAQSTQRPQFLRESLVRSSLFFSLSLHIHAQGESQFCYSRC